MGFLDNLKNMNLGITPEQALPMLADYMKKNGYKTMAFILNEKDEIEQKNYGMSLLSFLEDVKAQKLLAERDFANLKSDAEDKIKELQGTIDKTTADFQSKVQEFMSLNDQKASLEQTAEKYKLWVDDLQNQVKSLEEKLKTTLTSTDNGATSGN